MSVRKETYRREDGAEIVVYYRVTREPECWSTPQEARTWDDVSFIMEDVERAGRYAWTSSRLFENATRTEAARAARKGVELVLASEGFFPVGSGHTHVR